MAGSVKQSCCFVLYSRPVPTLSAQAFFYDGTIEPVAGIVEARLTLEVKTGRQCWVCHYPEEYGILLRDLSLARLRKMVLAVLAILVSNNGV